MTSTMGFGITTMTFASESKTIKNLKTYLRPRPEFLAPSLVSVSFSI
jgi:hypothetical protein